MGRVANAMRLGAKKHPQAFGTFRQRTGGKVVATCAIGAVLEVLKGQRLSEIGYWALFKVTMSRPCPDLRCEKDSYCISHLNDDHRWTREQIADHIEILEKELE